MEYIYVENHITRVLDQVLEASQNNDRCMWVPIADIPGSGKTYCTMAWLEHNKLKNVVIDATWVQVNKAEVECFPELSKLSPGVITVDSDEMKRLLTPATKTVNVCFSSELIDSIDKKTVVVIDNYDRASKEQRDELYKLIRFHQVVDLRAENDNRTKRIEPLMLVVILDSLHLDELSDEERRLFGMYR